MITGFRKAGKLHLGEIELGAGLSAASNADGTSVLSASGGGGGSRINVMDYGAVGDGVANDTDAFVNAFLDGINVYAPAGIYNLAPTALSGDFMLYLGTQGGQPDRNGFHFEGDGAATVLRLDDAVGRSPLLFSGAVGDVLQDMSFENFDIDLNGLNNLQTSFADPLRYNQAFYFFCKCTGFHFNNIGIKDASGSQILSIGGNSSVTYAEDVLVENVRIHNFGIGLPGNLQQDCSAMYLQGTNVRVQDCTVKCDVPFAFALARGHSAIEAHTDTGFVAQRNLIENVQLPMLFASTYRVLQEAKYIDNTLLECNYFYSMDGATMDQNNVRVTGNTYRSTVALSQSLINLGYVGEGAKVRDTVIQHNTIDLTGNLNNNVSLLFTESRYMRSTVIQANNIKSLTSPVVVCHSVVEDTDELVVTMVDNDLDSCGSISSGVAIGGVAPFVAPCFAYIDPAAGWMKAFTAHGNRMANTEGKDYSVRGSFYVNGQVRFVNVNNNPSTISITYPVMTGSFAAAAAAGVPYEFVWNVKVQGAVGDGVADDTTAIQNTINLAPAGAVIFFPNGNYKITSNILVNKSLTLRGSATGTGGNYGGGVVLADGSFISGTGFILLLISRSCKLESMGIVDLVGNAATVCVDVNNSTSGIVNVAIKGCYVTSASALGTGIRLFKAVRCEVENTTVEGFGTGVDLQSASKGNSFRGMRARLNTIGLKTTGAELTGIVGATFENNGTNIKHECGVLTITQSHVEALQSPQRNIHIANVGALAPSLVSVGNFYVGGQSTDKDIWIASGATNHVSIGDTFYQGIRHDGTGVMSVGSSLLTLVSSGTGTITVFGAGGGGPTGAAGGDLAGTYPNPTIAARAVTVAKMLAIDPGYVLGRSTAGLGDIEGLSVSTSSGLSTAGGALAVSFSGTWDGSHLVLGTRHFWIDATGQLRFQNGAPSSATDGLIMQPPSIRQSVDGWVGVATASQTDVAIPRVGGMGGGGGVAFMPMEACSVTGLYVRVTPPFTAGTLNVQVWSASAAILGGSVTIGAGNMAATAAPGALPIAAGEFIYVKYTTNGSFATSGSVVLSASVRVEYPQL